MPTPNISAVLSNADKTTIITHTNNSKALLPFTVNLDPTTRRKLRKTGSKREGYVQDVYAGTIANPNALPTDFSIPEWTKDEDLDKQLREIREAVGTLLEAIDDTILLLGTERIGQADDAYGFLKQSAKGNSALTTLIQRIARQFEGQGREGRKTTFTCPAAAQITVTDVSTSTQLVNIGTTELKIFKGNDSVGTPQTAMPGEGVTLASDATTITVVNQHPTANGAFTVKLKPRR